MTSLEYVFDVFACLWCALLLCSGGIGKKHGLGMLHGSVPVGCYPLGCLAPVVGGHWKETRFGVCDLFRSRWVVTCRSVSLPRPLTRGHIDQYHVSGVFVWVLFIDDLVVIDHVIRSRFVWPCVLDDAF